MYFSDTHSIREQYRISPPEDKPKRSLPRTGPAGKKPGCLHLSPYAFPLSFFMQPISPFRRDCKFRAYKHDKVRLT